MGKKKWKHYFCFGAWAESSLITAPAAQNWYNATLQFTTNSWISVVSSGTEVPVAVVPTGPQAHHPPPQPAEEAGQLSKPKALPKSPEKVLQNGTPWLHESCRYRIIRPSLSFPPFLWRFRHMFSWHFLSKFLDMILVGRCLISRWSATSWPVVAAAVMISHLRKTTSRQERPDAAVLGRWAAMLGTWERTPLVLLPPGPGSSILRLSASLLVSTPPWSIYSERKRSLLLPCSHYFK